MKSMCIVCAIGAQTVGLHELGVGRRRRFIGTVNVSSDGIESFFFYLRKGSKGPAHLYRRRQRFGGLGIPGASGSGSQERPRQPLEQKRTDALGFRVSSSNRPQLPYTTKYQPVQTQAFSNEARDFASKRGGERSSAQDYQVLGKCACERKRHRATFATSGERNASERIFSLFIS